ncbi:MAG: hypothetical protein WCV88_03825 [Patescibacteria group bacterium]|jgi:hypothetical protein
MSLRTWSILLLNFLLVGVLPIIPALAYEQRPLDYYQNDIQVNTGLGGYDNVGSEGPVETASRAINILLGLLGTLTLCLVIYAGFLWMTAQGNEEQAKKAKDILSGAVIGIVIILASYGITNYVFRSLVNITN